jgi:hypothetical protein
VYAAVVKNQTTEQRQEFDAALAPDLPAPSVAPRGQPTIEEMQRRIALAHGRE